MRPSTAVSVLVTPLLLGGCLPGPRVDPTRYYVLTPPAHQRVVTGGPTELPSLGLGPIELPGYLDRLELVSRPSDSQLRVADHDRWGEPLADGFSRVLRQELEALLGAGPIALHPFDARNPPELTLAVDVTRFEPVGTAPRAVELVGRWCLRSGDDRRVLATDETAVRVPITDCDDPEAEVAALSLALVRLAEKLAPAVGAAARVRQ